MCYEQPGLPVCASLEISADPQTRYFNIDIGAAQSLDGSLIVNPWDAQSDRSCDYDLDPLGYWRLRRQSVEYPMASRRDIRPYYVALFLLVPGRCLFLKSATDENMSDMDDQCAAVTRRHVTR